MYCGDLGLYIYTGFRYTVLQHIICILYCVFTIPSPGSFHHLSSPNFLLHLLSPFPTSPKQSPHCCLCPWVCTQEEDSGVIRPIRKDIKLRKKKILHVVTLKVCLCWSSRERERNLEICQVTQGPEFFLRLIKYFNFWSNKAFNLH